MVTEVLNGGLYQTILLFRCLLRWVFSCVLNFSVCLYPLLSRAAWYVGTASRNACSEEDSLDSLSSIILGSCFSRELGLKITIEFRMHRVDFLDVTFDLRMDTISPYMKENKKLVYVNEVQFFRKKITWDFFVKKFSMRILCKMNPD